MSFFGWSRYGLLDEAAAKIAADITRNLSGQGIKIGPMDTLIAGTTLAHKATLVTNNTGEFSRVRGLTLEDWS
jgi:tRNA(fMet)-specific endonuclease VapC